MNFDEIINRVSENPYSAFFHTPPFYKRSTSILLLNPAEIIPVYNRDDLQRAFTLVKKFIQNDYIGYCLIEYEAGYLLENKLLSLLENNNSKLIQFVLFKSMDANVLRSKALEYGTINQEEYHITNFKLSTSKQKFDDCIRRIKKYIKAGDTYQVNYTVKGKFNFDGSYLHFYKHLLFNQSAEYSAFINNGNNFIISVSPELFFNTKGNKIISRPMKGTNHRGKDLMTDNLKMIELERSEKNRAENVMIVDLLRNDIGKICKYGSVKVKKLFTVEKYETLYQMVSTISGKLNKGIEFGDIVKNIFPCGSITGAPKIRTMQIIHELEIEKRGIYTGAIGVFGKKFSTFNVAIRTITIDRESGEGDMGLGGGIVWDSNPDDEYNEIILKSEFLTSPYKPFDLIETMLVENGDIYLLEKHTERLKKSAEFFLFIFNQKKITSLLNDNIKGKYSNGKYKLRITLSKWGKINISLSELEPIKARISVVISDHSVSSKNVFQYFKTTNRVIYDDEINKYSDQGYFEVIFLNERKEIAEGSFTNIVIKKDEQWLTPAASCGILPGVYRNYLLQNNKAKEAILTVEDLLKAEELRLINSVRKAITVNKLFYKNEFVEYKSIE